MNGVGIAGRAIVIAFAVAAVASCSSSSQVAVKQVTIDGGTSAGTFEAVIRYPSAARAGKTVSFPMTFRNTGGRLASFQFNIAVDGPPGCAIQNMMAWRDVKAGRADWFVGGYNLDNAMATRTAQTFQFPAGCRGTVAFVVGVQPSGRPPIVRRFQVVVA
jgi:hypothetical protein